MRLLKRTFLHQSLIVKSQQNRIALVTRPADMSSPQGLAVTKVFRAVHQLSGDRPAFGGYPVTATVFEAFKCVVLEGYPTTNHHNRIGQLGGLVPRRGSRGEGAIFDVRALIMAMSGH